MVLSKGVGWVKSMGNIKKFIKSHPNLFASLKHGLLYVRYGSALLQRDKYRQLERCQYQRLIDIKENRHHCYFGYYDKSPVNSSGTLATFLRIKDGSKETDTADVCVYDLQTKVIKVVGHTNTWNWQQGCMLQWVNDNTVSFNSHENGRYVATRIDVHSRETTNTNRAVYFYNHSLTKYLSLNFYRLDIYAKGYGYPYQVDSMGYDKDGIWEVDVKSDASKLILSLKDVMAHEAKDYMECQHYINHVAYCPDERYIIFIHRWQVKGGEFVSRLIKYDTERGVLMTLLDNDHVSHYCWKSPDELLIYATNGKGEKGYMVVNILTGGTAMVEGLPDEDGHPSYSKDGKWILTDTYPNNGRKQYLFLFNVKEKKLMKLDALHSPIKYFNENRCDLHPRWSMDNKYICVDNTATGLRSLKLYQIA